ncbi:MAG: hypothetical protein A2888_01785 [Chlamydiae bacterium RIFCSPLOWO2_01_FULL_28_7]|nr:MAG: hypothetical protein A2888_01785 [Chlamydiae bacterium RIFCSPLOWO2_01_FULL_28_7]
MAIKLSLDKFGSDRLIYSFQNFFVKKNDFYNFIFSYFNLAETSYINTNRKTINFFKHTLYERVGEERLGRILKKLNIDLNEMEKRSLPLRSSTVIEILDGLRDVNVIDLDEFIKKIKNDEIKNTLLDRKIVQKIKNVEKFDEIDKTTCEIVFKYLSLPMDDIFKYIPEKPSKMTKILGKFFYNYSLLLNEKVFYCSTNHELTKEAFFERLCKKLARLELNIGSIIPAYNVSKEKKYYRVAAKLVTAEGLISYTLIPLTKDMRDIEPIRIFKGTSVDVSSLDFLSFLITDFEREIGRKAFLSGMKYEYEINKIAKVTTEIGFSLGGTIIQHRLASKNTIENAYLFNSPGVSKQIIEAVNKQ